MAEINSGTTQARAIADARVALRSIERIAGDPALLEAPSRNEVESLQRAAAEAKKALDGIARPPVEWAIDSRARDVIRCALLVGLASFGEIERLANQQELQEAIGRPIEKRLKVIHPTGSPDTTADFAAALLLLEYAAEVKPRS